MKQVNLCFWDGNSFIFYFRYQKANEIFEAIARQQINNNLLKYSVRGILLNAGICQLCRGDVVAITNSMERYQVCTILLNLSGIIIVIFLMMFNYVAGYWPNILGDTRIQAFICMIQCLFLLFAHFFHSLYSLHARLYKQYFCTSEHEMLGHYSI